MGLYLFVWPIYLAGEPFNASGTQIGLALALAAVVGTLGFMPGGFLADRFNRKKVLLLTWVIAVPAPLIWGLAPDWPWLILGIVLYSASFASIPAETAIIADRVKHGRRGASFGLVYAAFPLGWALGGFLGSLLLPALGGDLRNLFLLAFPFFCVSFLAMAVGLRPAPSLPLHPSEPRVEIPLRATLPTVVLPATVIGILGIGFNFVPIYLHDAKGVLTDAVALLGAATYVSSAPLGLLLGHLADRFGVGRAMALSAVLEGLGLLMLLFTPASLVLLTTPLLGFFAVTRVLGDTSVGATAARGRGRAYGLYFTLEGAAVALGSAGGGVLYDLREWLPFAAAPLLVVPLVVLLWVGRQAVPPTAPKPVASLARLENVGNGR